MELTGFLHAVINSCRLKGDQKFLGSGLGQSGDRTLKLTGSEEWTDGMTDIVHIDIVS